MSNDAHYIKAIADREEEIARLNQLVAELRAWISDFQLERAEHEAGAKYVKQQIQHANDERDRLKKELALARS